MDPATTRFDSASDIDQASTERAERVRRPPPRAVAGAAPVGADARGS